jgi:hypothetical protein
MLRISFYLVELTAISAAPNRVSRRLLRLDSDQLRAIVTIHRRKARVKCDVAGMKRRDAGLQRLDVRVE